MVKNPKHQTLPNCLSLQGFLLVFTALIVSISLSSCGGNDEPDMPKSKTTYTITVESNANQMAQSNGLTAKMNFIISEYNDNNERINIQEWEDIKDGKSKKTFTAHDLASKLVIQMDTYAYKNGVEYGNHTMYSAIIYYLKLGENLDIKIDGDSRVTKTNPL